VTCRIIVIGSNYPMIVLSRAKNAHILRNYGRLGKLMSPPLKPLKMPSDCGGSNMFHGAPPRALSLRREQRRHHSDAFICVIGIYVVRHSTTSIDFMIHSIFGIVSGQAAVRIGLSQPAHSQCQCHISVGSIVSRESMASVTAKTMRGAPLQSKNQNDGHNALEGARHTIQEGGRNMMPFWMLGTNRPRNQQIQDAD